MLRENGSSGFREDLPLLALIARICSTTISEAKTSIPSGNLDESNLNLLESLVQSNIMHTPGRIETFTAGNLA
jgi:hypothetical protein